MSNNWQTFDRLDQKGHSVVNLASLVVIINDLIKKQKKIIKIILRYIVNYCTVSSMNRQEFISNILGGQYFVGAPAPVK